MELASPPLAALTHVGNAFRVGTDGNNAPIPAASPTLPQPTFVGINSVAGGAGEALDPNFRPNVVDSFDLTIQRQLGQKFLLELGYIGRRITHEYQPININSVPYMMTLGGQQFQKAYAAVETGSGLRHILCCLRRGHSEGHGSTDRLCQYLRAATLL